MSLIINIYGPVAVGKSTLTEKLRNEFVDFAYVDRPFIKRGLKPIGKEYALKLSKEASYFLIEKLIDLNKNIIVQEINPESLKKNLGNIIENNNYKILSFYLTCSLSTAIERDIKRSAKTSGKDIVQKIHSEYVSPKDYETVLDTDKLSVDNCLNIILEKIRLSK